MNGFCFVVGIPAEIFCNHCCGTPKDLNLDTSLAADALLVFLGVLEVEEICRPLIVIPVEMSEGNSVIEILLAEFLTQRFGWVRPPVIRVPWITAVRIVRWPGPVVRKLEPNAVGIAEVVKGNLPNVCSPCQEFLDSAPAAAAGRYRQEVMRAVVT